MTARLTASLCVALLLPAACVVGDDAKQDTDKLKGTWTVVALEANGQQAPKEFIERISFTFDGEKLKITGAPTAQGQDANREYSVKLDPSKSPKAIDTTALNGPEKGKIDQGIYELKDDELRLCMPNNEAKERPKDFKGGQGSNF